MTRLLILALSCCLLAASLPPARAEARPYAPKPGRYSQNTQPGGQYLAYGDYVVVDYANTSEIRFTVVWSGIYSMP